MLTRSACGAARMVARLKNGECGVWGSWAGGGARYG